jgi:hypothetical protein
MNTVVLATYLIIGLLIEWRFFVGDNANVAQKTGRAFHLGINSAVFGLITPPELNWLAVAYIATPVVSRLVCGRFAQLLEERLVREIATMYVEGERRISVWKWTQWKLSKWKVWYGGKRDGIADERPPGQRD